MNSTARKNMRVHKSLSTNEEYHEKCLKESQELQKCLRHLTHQVLAAQEDDRMKISHELQDEIGQTLLAINIRLLCLKRENRETAHGLKNEVASVQRFVAKSAKSVRHYAHELISDQEGHTAPFLSKF